MHEAGHAAAIARRIHDPCADPARGWPEAAGAPHRVRGASPSRDRARAPGKIALLMSHSAPGGIRELWEDVAAGLAARGHAARVAALYPDRSGGAAGVEHVCAAGPRSASGLLRLSADLVGFLRRERFDAVFTAMPAANALVPPAVAAARVATRVVVTHHTPVSTYHRGLALADRWTGCLPQVRGVLTVSDALGAALDGHPAAYRRKRVTVHNALPPRIEARIAALRGTGPGGGPGRGGRRVVAVGRLAAQKNYPVLLRAAARMPDVGVEIVGSGPDEAMLRAMARDLGVADRVAFLGHLPREGALARMAEADLFVQPSLFEGHSLGLLEAAALHLPLVVSDVPVQVEGVTAPDGRRCGTVVSLHDDAALARAITGLLSDPGGRAAASGAAAHLAAGRTFGAMVAAYEALARGA